MKASTSTLLSLLALLPTTLSTPVPHPSTSASLVPFPNYSITDYRTACSPAGCSYSFSVSYTAEPCSSQICEPSFAATRCSGTNIQGAMVDCENGLVSSNETPATGSITLEVRHQWDQDVMTGGGGVDGRFWALASHTVENGVGEDGPASFQAAVGEIGGMA